MAEGLPTGGGVIDSALLLTSEDVADIWLKDQARAPWQDPVSGFGGRDAQGLQD